MGNVPRYARGPNGDLSDYTERGSAYEILPDPSQTPLSMYKSEPEDRVANNEACTDIDRTIGTGAGAAIGGALGVALGPIGIAAGALIGARLFGGGKPKK